MKLSELFNVTKQADTRTGGADTNNASVSAVAGNNSKINRQIRSLIPGQTIQGEVIEKNGSEIQIKLADDMVLSARLEREFVIDLGKIMTFEVKNNGTTLALSPLFANMATDANVIKALDMANIPVNDRNIEMTEIMMKQGMSIDKNSLQTMFHDVSAYPGTTITTLVGLHQLNIQVTPQNISQLESYKSAQHQIIMGMTNILEEIPMEFEALLQSSNMYEAINLYTAIAGTLSEEVSSEANSQTALFEEKTEQFTEEVQNNIDNNSKVQIENNLSTIYKIMDGEEINHLLEMLKNIDKLGEDKSLQELIQNIENKTATPQDILQTLSQIKLYSDVDISRNVEVAKLFSSNEYTKLIKQEVMRQWMIEPEAVQDSKNLEELYQRLDRQLSQIKNALMSLPNNGESSALKSTTNLQNNLEFMNQLNNIYAYIQLPLKMGNQNAHGELYVYTNKKSLAQSNGSISALLHLDMENLGPVDVYVAMQNQNVSTKFYLKDDDIIDFIEAHIHVLNERLEKRGYSMNCEMISKQQEKEQEKSIIERIMETDKNVTIMSQYAFDVRA